MQTDFFTSSYGSIERTRWRRYYKLLGMLDAFCDARLSASLRRARRASADMPVQRILLATVSVPGREKDLQTLMSSLTQSIRHQVTAAIMPIGERGKYDNINLALAEHDLSTFDWILIVDDDIAVPPHFLDLFVYFCWRERLQLAMPAHRFLSHKSFTVTERHWGSVARLTNFVEIGPVTMLHASLFAALTPFPSLRFAWGLDVLWSSEAKRRGWRLGVVDATPVRHLRPIGQFYNSKQAMQEGQRFLDARSVSLPCTEILKPGIKIW
jgi:hypothetical protein